MLNWWAFWRLFDGETPCPGLMTSKWLPGGELCWNWTKVNRWQYGHEICHGYHLVWWINIVLCPKIGPSPNSLGPVRKIVTHREIPWDLGGKTHLKCIFLIRCSPWCLMFFTIRNGFEWLHWYHGFFVVATALVDIPVMDHASYYHMFFNKVRLAKIPFTLPSILVTSF